MFCLRYKKNNFELRTFIWRPEITLIKLEICIFCSANQIRVVYMHSVFYCNGVFKLAQHNHVSIASVRFVSYVGNLIVYLVLIHVQ